MAYSSSWPTWLRTPGVPLLRVEQEFKGWLREDARALEIRPRGHKIILSTLQYLESYARDVYENGDAKGNHKGGELAVQA